MIAALSLLAIIVWHQSCRNNRLSITVAAEVMLLLLL